MQKLKELTVEEYTSPSLVTANFDESLLSVAAKMNSHNIRHIPILENSKVMGMISQRDLYSIEKTQFQSKKAYQVMTKEPFTVSTDELIHNVAFEMSKRKIGSAIVVKNDEVFGIFTTTDALNALIEIVRESI